nr:SurA N-terminal domain-containing protein [Sphingomonadaceae bacterium]
MLSFFRRALSSPLIIGLLGLIAIAFIITGVGTPSGLGALRGGGDGTTVATVGGRSIGEAEAARRAQLQLESARQQQQGLDMTAFVASGGIEQTVDQMINARAIEAFAQSQGMVASKRLVDGAIASIPAFQGPSGAFDRTTFLTALAQRKIPESQVRQDFAREAMTRALLLPVAGAAGAPRALVKPYAALLLEARSGQLATVPSTAFASAAPPSDVDVAAFYTRNVARYTLPERRIVKYALFDRSRFE